MRAPMAPRNDGGERDLRTHRLDIVAVGIDQERGVVARAIVRARTGRAVVATAGLDALGMEFPDRGVIGSTEGGMRAFALLPLVQIKPERRFILRPEARAIVVARTQDITERCQCRGVKANAGIEIADFYSDVVVHEGLHKGCVWDTRTGDNRNQWRASRSWKILRIPREPCRNFSGDMPAARRKVRTKLERSPKPTS